MHTFAGVKVLEDGTVRAAPHLVDLPDFSGQTAADKGPVVFDYRREDGVLRWQIALPVGVIGRFRYPDGRETALQEGFNLITEGT